MQAMCQNGHNCYYFMIGKCKYIHPPEVVEVVQPRCQNGPECYYFKKGKCIYYHSPQTYCSKSGVFKCPSGHFNTMLQLTGKPCEICRNSVQGYGLECTQCKYYVCRKCKPIHHTQFCNGTQLIPINKMKQCRKCNKLISQTNGMYYCPLKCKYFICKKCLQLEYSNAPPVKKKYVEKSKSFDEINNKEQLLIGESKQEA